ncbi:exodeoxyribonuclease VII large subunit [Deinococcus cellulosilyticus]|uniref:Exodeoxyribonuclease 7 large subunit n=1 Tax=Deinococcus cellulosilyticus (strain DSM 18568 / NBRC 106333 / KACC 11606 / 5516J-15) TaxID=1223518 RepID=A0A511N4G8_DEIC1|nr:exodeoxyribonuclease VII large subunit [Deinococcus cellulosilyticus]GEM47763.1 exodeoxyribonuclease 7 large subunit [Deinococcus cellulosilyticus NBRC 106333 = KACC 11606]
MEDTLKLSELLQYTSLMVQRTFSGFVWVQAEIASMSDRRHLYLELIEMDGAEEVAKCRASLWARDRYRVENKFKAVTGQALQAGLEVMLKANVEFHPRYGFSLNILDIAPAFTVGQLQIKLDRIRDRLQKLGVWDLQSRLLFPEVLSKVLVVTPEDAASLGDFQERIEVLGEHGVCEFRYMTATFQGKQAVPSLLRVLIEAQQMRSEWDWQVLVLLRGGGSVTDLHWLSDETLTRTICEYPMPVVTGIGHTRDQTLLDEVSALSLGTPSKVAQWVLDQALRAPLEALEHYHTILRCAKERLGQYTLALDSMHRRLTTEAREVLQERKHLLEQQMLQVIHADPQSTLQRGYALAFSGKERIPSRDQALQHNTFTLRFQDGDLEVKHEL